MRALDVHEIRLELLKWLAELEADSVFVQAGEGNPETIAERQAEVARRAAALRQVISSASSTVLWRVRRIVRGIIS